jgi:hypothetical protein
MQEVDCEDSGGLGVQELPVLCQNLHNASELVFLSSSGLYRFKARRVLPYLRVRGVRPRGLCSIR